MDNSFETYSVNKEIGKICQEQLRELEQEGKSLNKADRDDFSSLNGYSPEVDICEYGYQSRYKELKKFRKSLSKYISGYNEDETNLLLSPKVVVLDNGHVLDHHVLGYFAPFIFRRKGLSETKERILPEEQLAIVSDWLRKRGIRFIYVGIPCKLAVYPELVIEDDEIPRDGIIIPQWRNFERNILKNDVELVDCYSEFMIQKNEQMLFSKNHHISPAGASIIAKCIKKYIDKTTEYYSDDTMFKAVPDVVGIPVLSRSGDYNSLELAAEEHNGIKYLLNGENGVRPYIGNEKRSKIAIMGNCNLSVFRCTGFDITAQLSGQMGYPIKYIGRCLPFANQDSFDKISVTDLIGVDILVDIEFLSAPFVRAPRECDSWTENLP